jgi:glycosyltransferase involved in cell wall biosynthesis
MLPPLRLGVFFSHPTQHHSPLFQRLSNVDGLQVQVYYYDPGSLGGMYDRDFRTEQAWDIDLLSGTHSVILKNLLRGREINAFRQLNPAIPGIVIRHRFDAVFLSGYVSPSNWLALLSAKLIGARVLYQSDTNILDLKRKRRSRPIEMMKRTFLRSVDTFLAIGDKNREAYLSFGVKPASIEWCPIPVDAKPYNRIRNDPGLQSTLTSLRTQYGIADGTKVVALAGKLIPRKRPQDLVEAVRLLHRRDVCCFLIGSGEMESTLKAASSPLDQVRLTGFVNQSMIPYYLLLAQVGVICSEWDPHPLVATEFAMCGLPIVVSDTCGVWGDHDIVRNGENGFVYRCGNVHELAARLETLLNDEVLRQRMGARSLQLSEAQSVEHAAAVIERIVKRSRRQS